MQLAASGRDYWSSQVGLEHSLGGGTGRGCVTDAVIYAPACVEGRPRPPGGGMSQTRDGTQVPAVSSGQTVPELAPSIWCGLGCSHPHRYYEAMVEHDYWAYCFWETPQSLNSLCILPRN